MYQFSGSVNITNNWSVGGEVGFSLPKALGDVKFSGSKGDTDTYTMEQSISYEAPAHIRVREPSPLAKV